MGDATRTADPSADTKEFRGIAVAALWFGALTIAFTLADFISSIQPLSPTIAGWRYTSLAALTGFLGVPVMGAFAAVLAAAYLERPALSARLALACKLIAVLLVVALIVFLIDAMAMRAGAKPEERSIGDIGVVQHTVKYLFYSIAVFLAGRAVGARPVRGGN